MAMNVINEPVLHRQFGPGTITGQTTTVVSVEFGEGHGIKKFSYPSAFESFLELCDPKQRQEMDSVLQANREQAERERLRRAEAEEQSREEERKSLLKEKAAQKKSTAKKTTAKTKKKPVDSEPPEEETA